MMARKRMGQSRSKIYEEKEWIPKTRLGMLVASGKIHSLDEALHTGLPLREPQIVDILLPDLKDEVLDNSMVQRMTDSGRRTKFRIIAVVGNEDGYVGLGQAKDSQVGPAIRKAIENAKLNIMHVERGCGSWECGCDGEHPVPFRTVGKCGSIDVELLPAPLGLGIVAGATARKVLQMAGVKDVWTRTYGHTRTTLNFAKATFDALRQISLMRKPATSRRDI